MIERAQAMNARVYVPGHGFVEASWSQRGASDVPSGTGPHHRRGDTAAFGGRARETAIEQADFGPLDSWPLRSSQATIAIRRVYAELNGELPSDGQS
jgi:hypothetical protein